jgi:hypothetical protein
VCGAVSILKKDEIEDLMDELEVDKCGSVS